jgi:hypothetical protein
VDNMDKSFLTLRDWARVKDRIIKTEG